MEKIKKIYLNADGGSWVEASKTRIKGVPYVLEEFHLQKYLIRLISHMKDSVDDAYIELGRAIRRGTKADFFETVERLKKALPEESEETGVRSLEKSRDYILENWGAARLRLVRKDRGWKQNRGSCKPCTFIKDEFQTNGMESLQKPGRWRN